MLDHGSGNPTLLILLYFNFFKVIKKKKHTKDHVKGGKDLTKESIDLNKSFISCDKCVIFLFAVI